MNNQIKHLIDIQEFDIKMIRLMRIKKQRQAELNQVESLRTELKEQITIKKEEITELNNQVVRLEEKIQELTDKYKKLENQQSNIKKVDEFHALTKEMTTIDREKASFETQASNILDKKNAEEEILNKINESLSLSEPNSQDLEKEIQLNITKINEEGQQLKTQRDLLMEKADQNLLKIYERLLRNKKDRVIVPIENRTCSGCHIGLTIQHENLVRKGESIIFCEHCSRIHFWQESEAIEGTTVATKRRRRRTVKT